jgi:hypothetical protein
MSSQTSGMHYFPYSKQKAKELGRLSNINVREWKMSVQS